MELAITNASIACLIMLMSKAKATVVRAEPMK